MNIRRYIHRLILVLLTIVAWSTDAYAVCSTRTALDNRTTLSVSELTITPPDSIFYQNYPFIRFVEAGDSMTVSDEEFLNTAAKVIFPVNKFTLPKDNPTLRELEEKVIPQINADSLRLLRVMLRGAASPEGPFLNNEMLGRERAKSLFDFLYSRLWMDEPTPIRQAQGEINSVYEIEDYPLLCEMMKQAGDPDYACVKGICDKYFRWGYRCVKAELQKAQGGRLWKRLLREYFPQLRAARFVLFLEKHQQPEVPEVIDTISTIVTTDTIETDTTTRVILPEWEWVPRRELLAVKTNLLFDFAYMPGYDRWCPIPNIALEYYPLHGHLTFGASLDLPWWQHYWEHKYFQIRNYQLEARYYLRSGDISSNPPGKGAAYRGLYLQGYLHGGVFGICFDEDRGWVGEGFGGGIGIGYMLPISRKGHWRLEFGAQVGYFWCQYDPYQYENPVNPMYRDHLYYYKWTLKPSLFKKRQYHYNWFGPTRIGITISYDLFYRRQAKKGASLKSRERRMLR